MITDIVNVIAKFAQGMKDDIPLDQVADSIAKEKVYNKNMIAAAYSWIYEKINKDQFSKSDKNKNLNSNFRILSKEEENLIGLKNYNYLLHFYNTGILNKKDMEIIIEQIKMLPEESINPDNINILILFAFLNAEHELLPGSRLMLYSSDKIN